MLRFAEQIGIDRVACGKPLHLSIDGSVINGCAAVYIVIGKLSADDYVLNVDIVAVASGTTARNNTVWVELIDHALGAQGGIDLADATLLNQYVTTAEELL